jgi:ATP dependent DNA ligase domain
MLMSSVGSSLLTFPSCDLSPLKNDMPSFSTKSLVTYFLYPSTLSFSLHSNTFFFFFDCNNTSKNIVIIVASRVVCNNKEHLNNALMNLIDGGGEGVILRKPQSIYYHGRSTDLIKLKV